MRVGIVSFEFEGTTKNGGIGTAYRLLAETLAASGAKVTVLLTQQNYSEVDFKRSQKSMRALGIELEAVPTPARYCQSNLWFVAQSIAVYERLRSHRFDIVHFPENIGAGYYSVLSKKLGLDFKSTIFVAGLHGSSSWIKDVVGDPFPSDEQSLLFEFERRSVELSDVVVSPSEYMLRYTRAHGWKLPKESFTLPNVNRLSDRAPAKRTFCKPARQLIFFGRLEERKGIALFVRAIQLYLEGKPVVPGPVPVVFLGKDGTLTSGEQASDFIRRELAPLGSRVKLQFKSDLSSEAALRFLGANPESLVCMPSPVDNSPYVIVEALELGLNFVSSAKGGQSELIHADDRRVTLFDPSPPDLAEKFKERLFWVAPRARPVPDLCRAGARWVEQHRKWSAMANLPVKPRTTLADLPLVSVCVAPQRNPGALQSLLETMEFGLYPNVELLVGQSQPCPETEGLQITRIPVGQDKPWMRRFAQTAKGKYLLFLDQPGTIQPHAISLLVRLAETQELDRLCGAFIRGSPGQRAQSVYPTPEHAVGSVLCPDPRFPLLFQSRKRFLAESGEFTRPGTTYSEQSLWALESAISGRPFTCVPRVLLSVESWMPAPQELEWHRASACTLVASHLPPALSGVTSILVESAKKVSRIRAWLIAKDQELALARKGIKGADAH